MKYKLAVLLLTVFFFLGCRRPVGSAKGQELETYVSDANSIGFDISPAPAVGNATVWNATYSARGKIARFQFAFQVAKSSTAKDAKFPISFGEGEFLAVDGSDSTELLADLKKALESKRAPSKVARVSELPFEYAVFGKKMSQSPSDGGFNVKPPGNWTAMKIFIGEGENECEFFLNFNPSLKKGQFSMKDPDYGDDVIAQLAKVL